MPRCVAAALLALPIALAASPWSCAQQPQAGLTSFVEARCIACHGGDTTKGGLDLTMAPRDATAGLWRWRQLAARVRAGEMPPASEVQPPAAERAAFVADIAAKLQAEVGRLPPDPGRVTVRRLSRSQWANCVRDLFGVEVSTAGFPADDLGLGFDTIGDALTFSTLHLEQYLAAAAAVAAAVAEVEDRAPASVQRYEAEAMQLIEGPGVAQDGDSANLYTRAALQQEVRLPRNGVYRLRLVAGADQAGDEPARMLLRLDGRELDTFDVERRPFAPFELQAPLLGGVHRFTIEFVNDFYDPENADPRRRDRNLHVDCLEVVGPVDPPVVPEARRWLHEALPGRGDDAETLRRFVRTLLPRVWRRPATDTEQRRLVEAGAARLGGSSGLAAAVRLVVQAALASPHFLFRGETGGTAGPPGTVVPLSGQALASRLSFFLWASTPDARLLELAARGQLADRTALLAEVDRLLADPRADSLATEFAAQWLELRSLADRTPDPARFPGFDDELRSSLRRETELLFQAVLREGRDVRDLLDCDFTHVDARLAAFHGLPVPPAGGFHRVTLPPELRDRGGLLGHASVLAVTSSPTRTSPVKRGKWILENLLGQPPPPPPPGNDSLANEDRIDSSRSFREQLTAHRARADCATCHRRMDALGFALEHYDAIGRFRARDAGGAIDSAGELPNGQRLDGLPSLRAALVAEPAFVATLATRLFVYAVGREARPADRLRLEAGVAAMTAAGPVTLRDLVGLIAGDVAFRNRAVVARQ